MKKTTAFQPIRKAAAPRTPDYCRCCEQPAEFTHENEGYSDCCGDLIVRHF